ncbi:hypothetical protein [Vibrio hepatarius]|uniref:hypothetical protein n=1 Tax=Vibrio hepatarius TaxID=171383 RepID=UPI001C086843|nr:hypothetical protein [Vibrio hepatarius]MBU2896758.1 hypothetical protein [Vibrio hepatarius]
MRNTILKNIRQRFESLLDLVESLEPSLLTSQLDIVKSKSVSEHMWCIVGARESYSRALSLGKWDGFSCSLEETDNPSNIIAKLHSSEEAFNNEINKVHDWTPERHDLLVHLLEHETMHEGQLIRHIYALKQELPNSIKWA